MENQEIKTKRCPKCGRELPSSEFYVKNSAADGLQAWCKECQKIASHNRFTSKAHCKGLLSPNLQKGVAHRFARRGGCAMTVKKRYGINDYGLLIRDAKRLLPGLNLRLDAELSVALERVIIDFPYFENQIKERYGDEYEKLSLKEIIKNHYGNEAVELIESVL